MSHKAGYVNILGKPNVGKSTLIKILGGIYTIDGVAVAALAGYNLTVSVTPAALGPATCCRR